MINYETKTRLTALFVVAMFLFSATPLLITGDSDAENNTGQTYNIYLRTGDTFEYEPVTNLTSTKTASGDAMSSGLTFEEGKTLTGSFSTTGSKTATITATWSYNDQENNETLTQTATQTINFTVYGRTAITGTTDYSYELKDTVQGKTVATIGSVKMDSNATTQWTLDSAKKKVNGEYTSDAISSFSIEGETTTSLSIKTAANLTTGDYELKLTVKDSITPVIGTTITDKQTATVHVYVKENFSAGDITFVTYQGDNTTSRLNKTVTLSPSISNANYTLSDGSSATTVLSDAHITLSGNTFTIHPDAFTFAGDTTEGQSTSGTINMKVAGTITDSNPSLSVSDTFDIHYTVYAALGFITAPGMGNVTSFTANNGIYNAMITTNVSNARYIIYDWGDGSSDRSDVENSGTTFVSAAHKFIKSGTYQITVTAYNEYGNTASIFMYHTDPIDEPCDIIVMDKDGNQIGTANVKPGQELKASDVVLNETMKGKRITGFYADAELTTKFTTVSGPETVYASVEDLSDMDKFFEDHGYGFIITMILLIIALLLIRFGFNIAPVYAAAVMFAIMTVLLFFHKDLGGIWDAFTGLFSGF